MQAQSAPEIGNILPSYLVIANISKKQNIRTLITVAVAFGIDNILIVGQPNFEVNTHVAVSKLSYVEERIQFHRVCDLKACRQFLTDRNIRLYGVEIVDGATNIEHADFSNKICAFMMGNEGSGMNKGQLDICDEFVIIPQYGSGTASLNVSNAAAIVLQYFDSSRSCH
mmetsp:Transcript_4897/g.6342  ORF Transcript_4897/g.6342 Transcript_4897/m.6342 type:complete len:169 (+) Transcript_4897:79-585(+)